MATLRRRSFLLAGAALTLGCERSGVPAGPATSEPDPRAAPTAWRPRQGAHLIGAPAPAWSPDKVWINAEPLTLGDLRGQLVLLRFWLVGCGYCRRTAPTLVALDRELGAGGLRVIGMHHPKSARARDPEVVRAAAREYGFTFPIALDDDWEALRSYWLEPVPDYRFTSVSFLIDRAGVIRWVHDGGEYHDRAGPEYADARAALASLRDAIERRL